jgi:flagellar basal-body rod modification protein FlgD
LRQRSETGPARPGLGPVLLLGLLLLTLVAFVVARGVRVQDDIVNTVVLSKQLEPGGEAEISFRTTLSDQRADVLVTDTEDRQVRALLLGGALDAGPHEFTWDGRADDGSPAPAGAYGIRVILTDQGRDIKPPGRVLIPEEEEG